MYKKFTHVKLFLGVFQEEKNDLWNFKYNGKETQLKIFTFYSQFYEEKKLINTKFSEMRSVFLRESNLGQIDKKIINCRHNIFVRIF